jgi:hypothetical protein
MIVSSAAKQAITAATWEMSAGVVCGFAERRIRVRARTDPFPGCCLGKESTCDRANGGTEEGSGGEDAHGEASLVGRKPGGDQHGSTPQSQLIEVLRTEGRIAHMSAMTPPAEVSGLEPNIPAKKRKTRSVSSESLPTAKPARDV